MFRVPRTGDHPVPTEITPSDESLVEIAQNGAHWAYVELCERHKELMLSVVQRITRNSHDTEDVLQDAWMRGFVHIRTFDGRSAFSTWLARIAINSALMMLRKRKRRWHMEASLYEHDDPGASSRLFVEPSYDPEEAAICGERQLLVRGAIDRLPPSLRRVAQLWQSTDKSLKEIATLTGISVGATKSRLARARFALRKQLGQTYSLHDVRRNSGWLTEDRSESALPKAFPRRARDPLGKRPASA